tara:strand:+ start:122 stop:274 length:153 start_codon:yes stop_codon:yes gene_type:complete
MDDVSAGAHEGYGVIDEANPRNSAEDFIGAFFAKLGRGGLVELVQSTSSG